MTNKKNPENVNKNSEYYSTVHNTSNLDKCLEK